MNNKIINVLVVGDVMIDHYIYGSCNRISPEAPVQVVEVEREDYTLGGAGNVLKNLVAFNCKVDLLSVVGKDTQGELVLQRLNECGVLGDGLIVDESRCTTVKSRVLSSNHHLIRLDRESVAGIDSSVEMEMINAFRNKIADVDLVLISDYDKGVLTKGLLSEIFAISKAHGKLTLVDPKGKDFSKYVGVNIIKPNKKEAVLATGIAIKDKESLKRACISLKELTNCDHVIITLSEEGIAHYSNNELAISPTKALDVIDVTGAGDTVLASLGVSLAAGKSLHKACDFANHAAAIVVSKVGSAVVTYEEIKEKFFD